MPKVPNWTRVSDSPYPKWVHDITGDSIEVGPDDGTDWVNGHPENYQITLFSRDGLNNRVVDSYISSLEEAKKRAVSIACSNPDGELVKTMEEERNLLEWGEGG